jgi:choline kinase
MLDALHRAGIRDVSVVVGHAGDQVRAAVTRLPRGLRTRFIDNPEHTRGSLFSLHAARHVLHPPALIMDGDVVFPRDLLARLLAAPAPSTLLVDRAFPDTGEEIKIYTRGDRVIALGKKIVPEAWDAVGRSVGFFKCGAEAMAELHRVLELAGRDGGEADDYETALHTLVTRCYVGGTDVTGLPWMTGDAGDDPRMPAGDVWPRIVRLDSV